MEEGLQARVRRRRYDIGVQFEKGRGRFSMTKLIYFVPRFVVVNNTNAEVLLRQPNDGDEVLALPPKSRSSLNWSTHNRLLVLQMSMKGLSTWSGWFHVHEVSQFSVKLASTLASSPSPSPSQTLSPSIHAVFSVHVQASGSTVYSFFSIRNVEEGSPYRILNSSGTNVLYRQRLEPPYAELYNAPLLTLASGESVPYIFDCPAAPSPRQLEIRTEGWYGAVDIDVLGFDSIVGPPSSPLRLQVRRVSGAKQLRISSLNAARAARSSKPKIPPENVGNDSMNAVETRRRKKDRVQLRCMILLKRVCISLINDEPAELILASLDDIEVYFRSTGVEHNVCPIYCVLNIRYDF